MVIPILVTIEQARAHLRIDAAMDGSPSASDADLQSKINQATAIVVNYLARPTDTTWTATMESWGLGGSPEVSPPDEVVAAVLLQLGDLYRFRGDDPDDPGHRDRGYLSAGVVALLYQLRDPAVA